MSSTMIVASPQNLQVQSSFARLPAEIKHEILGYCFATSEPIVDAVPGERRAEKDTVPTLDINILRTCRRIYYEADRRQIFAQNTFRFTTADCMRAFFKALGGDYSPYVQDVEVDARKVHSNHPEIAKQWLQYLASEGGTWIGGAWEKSMESLRTDAPKLKCLRLNFSSWPTITMFRTVLWNLLRAMVSQSKGHERVVVVGASKGKSMARRDPWSPVHFVGGDDVGSDDLVEIMWDTVGNKDLPKVVRWERNSGKIYLEVVTTKYLSKQVDRNWAGPCTRTSYTDAWPENGSCTWFAYQNRNSDVTEPTTKGLNPSAAE